MKPDAIEEARRYAEDIIHTGENLGERGKELVDAGHGLLDEMDRAEKQGEGGGEGEGSGGGEEDGEGEAGGEDEGSEKSGKAGRGAGGKKRGGEGEGEDEGEGDGDEEGEGDGGLSEQQEQELKDFIEEMKRKAAERGQEPGDVDQEVEELYRAIAKKELDAQKDPKGPKVPVWVYGVGEGRSASQYSVEVQLDPDPRWFLQTQSQLTAAIQESRRLLQRIVVSVVQKHDYMKAGRMMERKLSQFYIESMTKPVERMYELNKAKLKNEVPAVAFVVDVSGSFVGMNPHLHMVHLAEAFRRFQPPNRFGMYIFADNWARVKGFNDPWSAVDRIADFHKAGGGTTLGPCLMAALQDISNVAYPHKLVVILSDFFTEDVSDVVIGARWGGVKVLPVMAGGNDAAAAAVLPKRQVFFVIQEYSEVVRVMLEYLQSLFSGREPPGAKFTPDSGTKTYTVPPRPQI